MVVSLISVSSTCFTFGKHWKPWHIQSWSLYWNKH